MFILYNFFSLLFFFLLEVSHICLFNGLNPVFASPTALFNMHMWRFVPFIAIEEKPEAQLSKNCRHSIGVLKLKIIPEQLIC